MMKQHNDNSMMSKVYLVFARVKRSGLLPAALVILLTFAQPGIRVFSQTETFQAGAFVINMGVTPQTVANGLKPYGLIYHLILNYGVPVKWIVEPTKGKDGIDFSHGGVDFRGGPFLIPVEYRTVKVDSVITSWLAQGVVGLTTTSPLTLPVLKTLTVSSAPKWTLDLQNGKLAQPYFVNAGIPPEAYGGLNTANWKNPVDLNCCDDIFVMPHADPKWATHSWLVSWNLNCKGSIWNACHSPSALENMYNPANISEQANFLSMKVTTPGAGIILPVTGSTSYSQNTLILWGNHSAGTPPYSYSNHGDPIMQFMGPIDAATLNGSEQIYIPVQHPDGGWRPSTVVAAFDPDHLQAPLSVNGTVEKYRATVIAYGRGFGDENRGYVMHEAGHSHAKAALPANIAAQRAFFNFSFFAAKDKAPDPEVDVDLSAVFSGTTNNLSFILTGNRSLSEFVSILWESSCGGSFSPNNAQNVVFTAPTVSSNTPCVITISLTDTCGRVYKASTAFDVKCGIGVTSQVTNPCFDNPSGGAITMSISNASGPYVVNWTRTSPAGSGGPVTLTTPPYTLSGLSAGVYSVTVTSNNGTGCSATFNTTLTSSPAILITATAVPVICPGGSNGSINVTVSGGTPGYTYAWSDGPTTLNRSGLSAGTYRLTVTDSRGCIGIDSAVVTAPATLLVTPNANNVTCFGLNNGIITLNVSGGTAPYAFLWNDGSTTQNRSALSPGTYAVTVTDANGCTSSATGIAISQPSAALTLSASPVNVLCHGAATGSINLTVSGGTPFLSGPPNYLYAWSGPGGYTSSSEDITGLLAGTYSVTVTDSLGCIASLLVTVTQPPALALSIVKTDPTCPPDADQNNADGVIDLSVLGGVGPYAYAWTASNGGIVPAGQEDDQDLSGLVSGTYTVVVTDANNCTATTVVVLTYLNPNPVQPGSIDH